MKKLLLIPLFILLLVGIVSAAVVETIQFKDTNGNSLTNVDYAVFTCLDASCSNVKIPNFTNGKNTGNSNNYGPLDDGEIVYPTNLETQYGYALYFYKDGYLPMEYFSDYRGNGYVNSEIIFQKKAQCSAPIDHIEVLNDVRPNIPLVIDISASLDADTYSAFHSNSNTPAYIPNNFMDFYSAQTRVILQIYKGSELIHTESQIFKIFMDSSKAVQFTWTPTEQNNYIAKITTQVIDNKCLSTKTNTATASFLVHEDVPQNACYTILNRPGTSNPIDPEVGEQITITGDKSSYYINNYQNIEPVDSKVTLTIYNSNGIKVYEQTKGTFSFTWTPVKEGDYTIIANGIATDSKCNGLTNYPSQELTIPLTVYGKSVPEPNTLELNFISNQVINEGSTLTFDVNAEYNGYEELIYSVENLPEGAVFEAVYRPAHYDGTQIVPPEDELIGYKFTWTPNYDTVSHQTNFIESIKRFITNYFTDGKQCRDDGKCEFKVTFKTSAGNLNDQQEVTISVRDVNRIPHVLNQLGPYIITEGDLLKVVPTESFTDLDFDKLTYAYTAPLDENGEWQTKIGDAGEYISAITASDGIATAQQDILIVVRKAQISEENHAPEFESIPDQTVYVGEELKFTIEANDLDNDELTYSSVELPTGSILVNQEFSWTPTEKGNYEAIFRVEDTKGAYDELTVKIKVKEISVENHAPRFIPVSDKTVYLNKLLTFTIGATDEDNDILKYSSPIKPTGSEFNPETKEFTWTPTRLGEYSVWFVVEDPHGERDFITVRITVIEEPITITLNLNEILSQEIKLGQSIQPIYITSGYNGENELTYSIENQPEGSAFTNQIFTWTPKQIGVYNIIFRVTDGTLTDTETAVITVTEEPKAIRATKHNIGIQRILVNNMDKVTPGEYFPVTVYAKNLAGLKEKDVRITISIPELNQAGYSQSFDLTPKQSRSETFMFRLPVNTDTKEYVLAVTVSNNRDKETKYVSIKVE